MFICTHTVNNLISSFQGGDIVLTREQEEILAERYYHNPFAPQRAVVPNMQGLWPNGIVPYVLDRNLSKYVVVDMELWKICTGSCGKPKS